MASQFYDDISKGQSNISQLEEEKSATHKFLYLGDSRFNLFFTSSYKEPKPLICPSQSLLNFVSSNILSILGKDYEHYQYNTLSSLYLNIDSIIHEQPH